MIPQVQAFSALLETRRARAARFGVVDTELDKAWAAVVADLQAYMREAVEATPPASKPKRAGKRASKAAMDAFFAAESARLRAMEAECEATTGHDPIEGGVDGGGARDSYHVKAYRRPLVACRNCGKALAEGRRPWSTDEADYPYLIQERR